MYTIDLFTIVEKYLWKSRMLFDSLMDLEKAYNSNDKAWNGTMTSNDLTEGMH